MFQSAALIISGKGSTMLFVMKVIDVHYLNVYKIETFSRREEKKHS